MSRVRLIVLVALAGTFVARPLSAAPITIGFDGLAGTGGSIFNGTTEDGFTVSPIVGLCGGLLCFSPWRVHDLFGIPEPMLIVPTGVGGQGTLEVSAGGARFIPATVPVVCAAPTPGTSPCLVTFIGFLGGVQQFGHVSFLEGRSTFESVDNPFTTTPIDSFHINLAFGGPATSVGLDNITVNALDADDPPAVPEPAALTLLGGGFAALVAKRRRTFERLLADEMSFANRLMRMRLPIAL